MLVTQQTPHLKRFRVHNSQLDEAYLGDAGGDDPNASDADPDDGGHDPMTVCEYGGREQSYHTYFSKDKCLPPNRHVTW